MLILQLYDEHRININIFYLSQSRQEVADKVLASLSGKGVFISPVNHHDVIAGQGTIALELLEQVESVVFILVVTRMVNRFLI